MSDNLQDPMLEMFVFETCQMLDQLEEIIIGSERNNSFSQQNIDEIFRIMHTIKGSSAMMAYSGITMLAHAVEDLFHCIREEKPEVLDFEGLTNLILKGIDFIKIELSKINRGEESDGDSGSLADEIRGFLKELKKDCAKLGKFQEQEKGISQARIKNQNSAGDNKDSRKWVDAASTISNGEDFEDLIKYKAIIFFQEGCEMENVRAFSIIHTIKDIFHDLDYYPSDIKNDNGAEKDIRENGFVIYFRSEYPVDTIRDILMQTVFLRHLELMEIVNVQENREQDTKMNDNPPNTSNTDPSRKNIGGIDETPKLNKKEGSDSTNSLHQNVISVSVSRLDRLMDLMGEMVIAEAMVIQNPDLKSLQLDNFNKAARQLNKITNEMQNMVMSIRMVPLSVTFHKMRRIIRDMGRKLDKNVHLEIIGEKTEVDKNIIEHISDPLIHLVRNSLDHGIEPGREREQKGKPAWGTITLEAKNSGSDVLIIVKDDGRGLDKDHIIKKAKRAGLLNMSEKDIPDNIAYNLILAPGFSTKEKVTEYSGRGVGMDVVMKNIQTIGGSVSVDSAKEQGTTITLKIPLTLAIIDGMNVNVGNTKYTIPTSAIRESFRPNPRDIIYDPNGNEMVMVRGQCYPILRLHKRFKVRTPITEFDEGMLIMVEGGKNSLCLFVDGLLGQQQVVVKTLPQYISQVKKIRGLAGCTLLGDGSISLILDIEGLMGINNY